MKSTEFAESEQNHKGKLLIFTDMVFSALVNLCHYIGLSYTVFLRPTSDVF